MNNLPNDVASWAEVIDHQLRDELVKAGPEKYQNKEAHLLPATKQLKLKYSTKLERRSVSKQCVTLSHFIHNNFNHDDVVDSR